MTSAARAASLHALVLVASSLAGIAGYYHQHGAFQITACIPAAMGLLLLVLSRVPLGDERLRTWLLFAITLGFGIVVARLALRFAFQDFQPLRKRIYFPLMALSSVLCCGFMIRRRAL